MWDRPELLTAAANLLYGLAIVAIMYMVLIVAIHLPIFPVREVLLSWEDNYLRRSLLPTMIPIICFIPGPLPITIGV